ncbi:MAG: hypothetical protein ACYC1L_04550 [Alphaproteobacteria bacterium]
MTNLAMDHEERAQRNLSIAQVGRWLMAVLMIFLGLSGPALCYIKAVEPHVD